MNPELYPLKFRPLFKEKIWGGQKLKTALHKKVPYPKTGESWEISAVDQSVSVVRDGPLKGESLTELLETYRDKLVGQTVYQKLDGTFPLLFKFIDAAENLSLQLHPDDQLAQKRHGSLGKTEMWYIVQADKNAGIYAGFAEGTTKEDYLHNLKEGKLESLMNFEPVRAGDVFFIKPGLVHAIGKGVLLAEIQQSSDITYRVFDWNRTDADGNTRQLHVDLALEAIDFQVEDYKISYTDKQDSWQNLVENPYFKTRKLSLNKSISVSYASTDSFVVLMCVGGELSVKTKTHTTTLTIGETLFIPACIAQIELVGEQAEVLEVTV